MPAPAGKSLGTMKPLGGGDPIPMTKPELSVGRRPTNDICLDFHNISGKHCQLKLVQGVWHVRDLGSTNGTTVNGQRINGEHGVMPDDELGIAGHFFFLDYEPIGPSAVLDANQILEEEMGEPRRQQRSLMELAGLERSGEHMHRPSRPPEKITRKAAEDNDFDDAVIDFEAPKVESNDDDFLDMIRSDIEDEDGPPRPKRR